ncbi:hypothetical protein Bca52824_064050 [Brassica carinata]|uniref:Uncharacterized protein n=1 Tax=Brassica carinata TaxID=52824 RepID=A0A8X7QFV1_BRACI|nr:hypothetical protein Bca52824_064050 [Brassica carinata]
MTELGSSVFRSSYSDLSNAFAFGLLLRQAEPSNFVKRQVGSRVLVMAWVEQAGSNNSISSHRSLCSSRAESSKLGSRRTKRASHRFTHLSIGAFGSFSSILGSCWEDRAEQIEQSGFFTLSTLQLTTEPWPVSVSESERYLQRLRFVQNAFAFGLLLRQAEPSNFVKHQVGSRELVLAWVEQAGSNNSISNHRSLYSSRAESSKLGSRRMKRASHRFTHRSIGALGSFSSILG